MRISGEMAGNFGGGVVGMVSLVSGENNIMIQNCINYVNIKTTASAGGIVGSRGTGGSDKTLMIADCINYGEIEGQNFSGGIIGLAYETTKIINCCNIGKIVNKDKNEGYEGAGGIIGGLTLSNELLTTQNCYYLNTNISKGIGGWNTNAEALEDIQGLTDTEMKSTEVLEKLNNYVTENITIEGVVLKKWIVGEDGYPIFEKNI